MVAVSRPEYVDFTELDRLIDGALQEDIGSGDVTSDLTLSDEHTSEGQFSAKESGIVAGLEVAGRVFQRLDESLDVVWLVNDGSEVRAGTSLGRVAGSTRRLLLGERLALNFLQRMSGIATNTGRFVNAVAAHPAKILDTRKTAPGLRVLDKWAVALGGGQNHRVGLFDMILIKDNHIAATGCVSKALQAVGRPDGLLIEIEAKTLDQVEEIVRHGGVDRILLDNMVSLDRNGAVDTSMLLNAVRLVDGRFQTEASGNISLDTVSHVAATGVDFISVGALTHSVRAMDITMNLSRRD